jgi:SAM-dependent methyltransferase
MTLEETIRLTKAAYNQTAAKYHHHFLNEINEKEYDRLILDKFSNMLVPGSLVCDAGCGPSGHIGKYLFDKGYRVTGVDISEKCIEIASNYNPDLQYKVMDIMNTSFDNEYFDAIIAFYSIIYTPKEYVNQLFSEFRRILKPNGKLLMVVKRGDSSGIIDDEWYEGNKVHFSLFKESEIENYFTQSDFNLDFFETRQPYEFEINMERIYAIGTKK